MTMLATAPVSGGTAWMADAVCYGHTSVFFAPPASARQVVAGINAHLMWSGVSGAEQDRQLGLLADAGAGIVRVDGFELANGDGHPTIKIRLRYTEERERVISGIRRISKPGRRVYRGASDLPRVLGGLGVAIISTSQGVMTDKQARQARVGGEILAYVW